LAPGILKIDGVMEPLRGSGSEEKGAAPAGLEVMAAFGGRLCRKGRE